MKKIVVLTTKTFHHNFFCQQLLKKFSFQIIYETKKIKPKYKIFHPYYKKRDKFEKINFFGSKKINYLFDYKVKNLNDKKSIDLIKKINPTHILCFGISKLEKNFIKSFSKVEISNLHGGDPDQVGEGIDRARAKPGSSAQHRRDREAPGSVAEEPPGDRADGEGNPAGRIPDRRIPAGAWDGGYRRPADADPPDDHPPDFPDDQFNYATGAGLIQAEDAVAAVADISIQGKVFEDFGRDGRLSRGDRTLAGY